MSSLDDQLLAGERIVYRSRSHWILFAAPILVALAGTGGTHESMACIPRPLEFRRQVQGQIVALDERRGGEPPAAGTPPDARVERDCPWCAERILARARVCKHCGRAVEPV